MTKARDLAADWLASRLRSSDYPPAALHAKSRFAVRVATATYRDTFLAGRRAVGQGGDYFAIQRKGLTNLNHELVDMVFAFLHLKEGQGSRSPSHRRSS